MNGRRVEGVHGAVRAEGSASPQRPWGWASAVAFVCLVGAVTFATDVHALRLSPFVASATRIAAGELWLVPASALVVDRPVVVGLIAFAALAFAALRVCGARVFWIAAAGGHIGSTLAVYGVIGVSRLADPSAFATAAVTPDYGVSAIQGAWVGAIATTAWLRAGKDRKARAGVTLGVCALAWIAWWLHPDPSILTMEHLLAFLIGCGIVFWPRLATATKGWLHAHGSLQRDAEDLGGPMS